MLPRTCSICGQQKMESEYDLMTLGNGQVRMAPYCRNCRPVFPVRKSRVKAPPKPKPVSLVKKRRKVPKPPVPVTQQFICQWNADGNRRGWHGQCDNPPAWGTSYCPQHMGSPFGGHSRKRQGAAERLVGMTLALLVEADIVEDRLTILANPMPVDPGVLLLEEVARCATVIRWLENRISEMSEADLMWEPELLMIKERKRSTNQGGDSYTIRRRESRTTVSRYWKLLERERMLLIRATEAALRSNIEERRVRLAERGVSMLEDAVSSMLIKLGLDPHSEDVRAVVGAELRKTLEAGGNGNGSIFMGATSSVVPVEAEVVREERVPPPPPADF